MEVDQKHHDDLYLVEYQWIPQLVDDINSGEVDWGILTHIDGWKQCLLSQVQDLSFDWEEMRHEVFRVDENALMVVYVFPEPIDIPLAAFGAVYVRTDKKQCAYYTVEKSHDEVWMIGSMMNQSHRNFGPLMQPSIESFLRWVVDRHNVI